MTTYYESAEETTISKTRAIKECRAHGCSDADMFAELGERDEYEAQEVLRWLGY